jgi:hypothetical protein
MAAIKQVAALTIALAASACASVMPPVVDEGGAVAAAAALMAKQRGWSVQDNPTYSARPEAGGWSVVASCSACRDSSGAPSGGDFVIRVDRRGRAQMLLGLGSGKAR